MDPFLLRSHIINVIPHSTKRLPHAVEFSKEKVNSVIGHLIRFNHKLYITGRNSRLQFTPQKIGGKGTGDDIFYLTDAKLPKRTVNKRPLTVTITAEVVVVVVVPVPPQFRRITLEFSSLSSICMLFSFLFSVSNILYFD